MTDNIQSLMKALSYLNDKITAYGKRIEELEIMIARMEGEDEEDEDHKNHPIISIFGEAGFFVGYN